MNLHIRRPSLAMVSVMLLAVVCTTVFVSCGDTGNRSGDTASLTKMQCQEIISSAFGMLQPERLGIRSNAIDARGILNQWTDECGASSEAGRSVGASAVELLKGMLSTKELEKLTDEKYTNRDVETIRTCLLFERISGAVVQDVVGDRERIAAVFDFVVQNIDLVDKRERGVPLTPFEIVMVGIGTAEDRAWVFANLLRQVNIDSVILRPASDGDSAGKKPVDHRRWLFGVLLEEDVYLYDMRLGWPIPSDKDDSKSVTMRHAATLAEVVENDAVFRRLDLGSERPYPLRADDFKKVTVDLIGQTSFWSPRMGRLQEPLSGDRSVVIYDPIDDPDDASTAGLLKRVVAAGKERWEKADIRIWLYPEKTLKEFESLSRNGRIWPPYPEKTLKEFELLSDGRLQMLRARMRCFSAPIPIAREQTEQKRVFGEFGQKNSRNRNRQPKEKLRFDATKGLFKTEIPEFEHLAVRINQLTGEFKTAVRGYVNQRHAGDLPRDRRIPAIVIYVHFEAVENASFWLGVSLLAQRDLESASATLRHYLAKYPEGRWADFCRGQLAIALARRGMYTEAVGVLSKSNKNNLKRDGYDLLIRRWSAQSTAAADEGKKE